MTERLRACTNEVHKVPYEVQMGSAKAYRDWRDQNPPQPCPDCGPGRKDLYSHYPKGTK